RPRQLHQRVVHVDDLIKPRAEQILLAGLPSLAWSHRKSPLHQPEREESRLAIRGNPQNRICKKIALQRPKTGKFDYLSEPNHPAHSMAFKFFTDDDIAEALVVAAHANAELCRSFFQGLQTTLGQGALDVRIVLHRTNVPRERSDHAHRRPFRADDPNPWGEFIPRQPGLGRRRQPRTRLEPL